LSHLSFLLCPDRSAARRVRRQVAAKAAGTDILVGTWPELIQHARDAYLLADLEESWSSRLAQAATALSDAFWSRSLALALPETIGILDRTLKQLLTAAGPGKSLDLSTEGVLSERGRRHLADLARLHAAMERPLPPELCSIAELLAADSSQALRTMTVYLQDVLPELNPWQQALIAKLNRDAGNVTYPQLQALLAEGCTPPAWSDRPADLAFLQDHLYTTPAEQAALDGSLQWLAVRDHLQEAEVAAGMVQLALAEHADLTPAEIGLLLPDDPRYALAVRETFSRAGLPLAGLVENRVLRDLGRELLFYLLLSLNKPAPSMAFAALLASPLLPWGRSEGLVLAQAVMDGNFQLKKMDWPASGKLLLHKLVSGVEKPVELLGLLELVETGLPADETFTEAVAQVRSLLAELAERLVGRSSIAWEELIALAAPLATARSIEGEVPLAGIAVFQEGQEAWRPVKRMFVLGFNNSHYPQPVGFSPVFSEADQERLKEQLQFKLETSSDIARHRRQRFLRQLGYASEQIHFLLSRRDAFGKGQGPSASLTFMAQLFACAEPEELLLELDTESGRQQASGLSLAENAAPVPPRDFQVADLNLGCDLLALQKKDDGSLYPMSPSRLETLMASPLAWVLGRSGLDPREWAPEELDVAS
jgi:hypothetical protein